MCNIRIHFTDGKQLAKGSWVVIFRAKIQIGDIFYVLPAPMCSISFFLIWFTQTIFKITLAVFTIHIYFVAKNTPNGNWETFSFK